MDKKIKDRVAVISGATSGIGLACANEFYKKGYRVYCLARSKPEDFPYNFVKCDLTVLDDIKKAVDIILTNEQKIDVLVSNAGMGISGPLEYCTEDEMRRIFELNLYAGFNLAKEFLPQLKKQGGGKIIFTSSVGSIFPLPFQAFYSASKVALETMAKAWRIEVAPFKVDIACILPGDTKTDFTKNREKNFGGDANDYAGRDVRSITKMEKDEQKGMMPESVAKVVFKLSQKRKMPATKIVGFSYKLLNFLNKILPQRLVLWVVKLMYAK